jgi:putative acetyltransferase
LTELKIVGEQGEWVVLGLGPVAVMPAFQNQKIGSKLIRHAIQACPKMAYPAILLLGHTTYYPRFGFLPASQFNIRCAFSDAHTPSFMALELFEGALQNISGIAHYQPEFADV